MQRGPKGLPCMLPYLWVFTVNCETHSCLILCPFQKFKMPQLLTGIPTVGESYFIKCTAIRTFGHWMSCDLFSPCGDKGWTGLSCQSRQRKKNSLMRTQKHLSAFDPSTSLSSVQKNVTVNHGFTPAPSLACSSVASSCLPNQAHFRFLM